MRPFFIPKYRRFKPKKLGLVVIHGKQHYLGPYGSPESIAEYNRLIHEHFVDPAAGLADPGPDPSAGATITQLIAA